MDEKELVLLETPDESEDSEEAVTLVVRLDPETEAVLSVEELI
jgi:hypothetical protein